MNGNNEKGGELTNLSGLPYVSLHYCISVEFTFPSAELKRETLPVGDIMAHANLLAGKQSPDVLPRVSSETAVVVTGRREIQERMNGHWMSMRIAVRY